MNVHIQHTEFVFTAFHCEKVYVRFEVVVFLPDSKIVLLLD